eukprot:tig00000189_g14307.t1
MAPATDILEKHWDALNLPAHLHHWLPFLVKRYSEPNRFYHNVHHLEALFELLDAAVAGGEAVRDKTAITLAAFFHDAVYDTKAQGSSNEAKSAALFRKFAWEASASKALSEKTAAAVEAFIMATAKHCAEGAENSAGPEYAGDLALFLDLDLAILGQDRAHYLDYAGQIRQEYAAVEEGTYRAKRAEVLRGMLAAKCLFRTPFFGSRLEQGARANLAFEVAELDAGRIPPAPHPAGIPHRLRLFLASLKQ